MLIGFRILLGVGESIYLPGGTKIVTLLFTAKERGLPTGLFDFGTRTGLILEGILVPWLLVRHEWRRALLNRNLLGICLGFFCFDYYWYVLVTWLPDYLVTVRHLSIVQAGFYASLAFFTFGVAEPIGGWVADSLIRRGWDETRTRKGIVTGAFFMSLFLVAAMRTSGTPMAIGLLIGASLVGLATGNLLTILHCAPFEKVGIWTGAENFAGNLAGIIAPLAVGFLIKRSGSYVPGFELGVIVLLLGLLAYWFVVGELEPRSL